MKLAYVSNISLTGDWAHPLQVMHMCKAFTQNGVEVILVVPKRNLPNSINPFQYYGLGETFKIRRIPCIDVAVGSENKFFYWLRLISFYVSARVYVWFKDIDYIYSRDMQAPLFFPGVFIERHSFPKKISSLVRWMYKTSGGITVLTSFIKERMVEIGVPERKILVAPDAVDAEAFAGNPKKINIPVSILGISEGDYILGYIGTLKTMGMEKGVADCLQAFKQLPGNFKLLVVGGEPLDIEYYKNMAVKLGLNSRTIFLGKVPHAEIPAYTQLCDVLLAPFPENEHYSFFMSPLKIFEYMASHRPIISTNLPSIMEVLKNGENALLVTPGKPEEIALAITRLAGEPDLAKKLTDKAYEDMIFKYTWKKRAENILNFIKSLKTGNK